MHRNTLSLFSTRDDYSHLNQASLTNEEKEEETIKRNIEKLIRTSNSHTVALNVQYVLLKNKKNSIKTNPKNANREIKNLKEIEEIISLLNELKNDLRLLSIFTSLSNFTCSLKEKKQQNANYPALTKKEMSDKINESFILIGKFLESFIPLIKKLTTLAPSPIKKDKEINFFIQEREQNILASIQDLIGLQQKICNHFGIQMGIFLPQENTPHKERPQNKKNKESHIKQETASPKKRKM